MLINVQFVDSMIFIPYNKNVRTFQNRPHLFVKCAQCKFTAKWLFSSFIHINDSKVQFCVGIILQYTVEYANLYSGIELIVIFNENRVFNE